MFEWQPKPGFELSGKRALVVGMGNPAGRAVAMARGAGADVAVASATLDGDEVMAAKRAAKDISATGRESYSQGWDVTLPTNVQVGLKQLTKEFGHPSILVYNADYPFAKAFTSTTDAEFARVTGQPEWCVLRGTFVREGVRGRRPRAPDLHQQHLWRTRSRPPRRRTRRPKRA